jgi:hypothetical protein
MNVLINVGRNGTEAGILKMRGFEIAIPSHYGAG